MLVYSFLSVFEEGSFMWIVVEGRVVYCTFQFEKEGLMHTQRCGTRISRIRYSSIPKSSNRIT